MGHQTTALESDRKCIARLRYHNGMEKSHRQNRGVMSVSWVSLGFPSAIPLAVLHSFGICRGGKSRNKRTLTEYTKSVVPVRSVIDTGSALPTTLSATFSCPDYIFWLLQAERLYKFLKILLVLHINFPSDFLRNLQVPLFCFPCSLPEASTNTEKHLTT